MRARHHSARATSLPTRITGPRLAAALATLTLSGGALSPSALADGDPASDVLLGANVFYPYTPRVAPKLQRALNSETAAAARGNFHLKVALIDGPSDLGVVPQMFGRPTEYAKFLDQELRLFLGPHPPLLVIMPGGYGVEGLPTAAARAAGALPKPSGSKSDDLARAAIAVVPKLAAAAGHPISRARGFGSSAGGGVSAVTLGALGLAAVAIAGGVLATRRRLARRT